MNTDKPSPATPLPDSRELPRQAPDRNPDGGGQGGNVKPGPRPQSIGDDPDPFPPKDTDRVPRRDPSHR